ncbi:hypothetical protein H0H92_005684 [Tricholoma furcatifolium]|nr:hypothetical protein H0H92_005684 [Tricholoma furcatifolium]
MTVSLRSAPSSFDDCTTKTAAHLSAVPQGDMVSHVPAVKRARLSTLYQRLHSFNQATPIGSLPPEILCYIFELAHLKAGNFRPWHHPDQRRPVPFTVSQVSGHWREVALNSPLLWSYVDISPPWSFTSICLALCRTKDCPLTINLTITDIAFGSLLTPSVINASASVLCGILAPHIPRCRKLIVKGDFTQLEHLFTSLMKTLHNSPTPFLEQLVFLPTGVRHTLAKLQPYSLGHEAPLAHLRVTTGMVQSLPFVGDLTSLHLATGDRTALELSDFTAIASSCPRLATLAIFDEAVYGPWPLEALVDFPSLRSLQIYGSFMSVSDLLRVVEAPLLEDLVIAPFTRDDLADYYQYTRHREVEGLDPKFATLRSITLSPVNSSCFALTEAAECFPDVELVMIPNIHADSFRDIFTDECAELVWPNLQGLALRNIDLQSMERLLSVITFRETSGNPLKTLYLDHDSIMRISSMQHLFPPTITLLEYDIWSTLKNEDLLQDPAHFVGNEFDFIPH